MLRARPLGMMLAATVLLGSVGWARAGMLTTTDDTTASDLVNALTMNGAGGITITGYTLSANTDGSLASSGIYTTSGTNNFGLTGTGVVISSGDAAQDGTTGAFIQDVTTNFGTDATASQTALLSQATTSSNGFHDVTELDITFNAGPNTNAVYFNTVFTSAEYPAYVGSYIDGFGLFLNGTNIAYAGGQPVNIDSPYMVNTAYPNPGDGSSSGNDGTQYQTTPEQGVLVLNGSAVVTYGGAVTPGSTGNTLTFIIADANDGQLDTTAFIQGLGNAPPSASATPEPASLVLLGIGAAGLGVFRLRRRTITV